MKVKHVLFLVILAQLSCAERQTLEIPSPPRLDEYFHNSLRYRLPGSECPDLNGHYGMSPKTIIDGRANAHNEPDGASIIFRAFPFHLADSSEGLPDSGSGDGTRSLMSIRQPSNRELIVELKLGGGTIHTSYTFWSTQGDFACRDGLLIFPLQTFYGGIEGQHLNGQSRDLLTRLENSMLIAHSFGPLKSRKVRGEETFTHEYFLFERVGSTGR